MEDDEDKMVGQVRYTFSVVLKSQDLNTLIPQKTPYRPSISVDSFSALRCLSEMEYAIQKVFQVARGEIFHVV